MKKIVPALLVVCLSAVAALAVDDPPDISPRARGAGKVVVATVADVTAEFGENEFGDRLIYSQVTLDVDETLKGVHAPTVVVTVEGGTVGDTTLTVSDMPSLARGQRTVLFLDESSGGGNVPHERGRGVLKVRPDDRIDGTSISLEDIRSAVKTAQSQGGR